MILSPAFAAAPGAGWLAAGAAAAYALAALPGQGGGRRWPAALVAGVVFHAGLLIVDIAGVGRDPPGTRLGFAPVLSLTVWLVLAVHTAESRLVPLPQVRRVLALMGVAAVVLAWFVPGDVRVLAGSPWAPLHWLLGVASYGLFGAAVLHAAMLDSAEKRMRTRAAGVPGGFGMPLLQLERLTFRFVEAGFVVLTAALLLGVITTAHWRWDHKTVFSLLAWLVFAALLAGRRLQGWRGRRATRWLYAGTALLLLAYAGSRFVMQIVLGHGGD
ncbi:MAG: cytochrome c biogenesis protein CcsA [Burkholderiales bacterium]|nr:cytochrome c biogenesis protein CcsA [Burkholderiales bacterium]